MQPWDAARLVSSWQLEMVLASVLRSSAITGARLFTSSLSTLVRSIQSDRLAGRDAAWAQKQANNASQEVYAELFRGYELFLEKTGRLDMTDVHRLAAKHSGAFCRERHLEGLMVCRNVQLLPDHEKLLRALGRGAKARYLLGETGLSDVSNAFEAGNVFGDWDIPAFSSEAPPNVRVIEAATRREEVWSVLCDILEHGNSWDDVELAVSSVDLYRPHIEAACERLSIPLTSRTWTDGTIRPSEIALRGILSWIASGYRVENLQDLLRSGVFFQREGENTQPLDTSDPSRSELSPQEVSRLLGVFRLTPAAFSNPDLRAVLLEGAGRERVSKKEVDRLLTWFQALRERLPDRVVIPRVFAEKIAALLRFAGVQGVDEFGSALERVLEPLQESGLPPVESEWLAGSVLKQLTGEGLIAADSGAGLHVSTFEEAGFGPRGACYVLGLDDQASSSNGSEGATHPVGFESSIPPGFGDPVPPRHIVAELQRRFDDRLVFSVSAWDVAASRSLFPGSALVEAVQMETIRATHRPYCLDPADCYRRDPWRQPSSEFSAVQRGIQAELKRNETVWTEYDGLVATKGSESNSQSPVSMDLRMSPSRLEVMLSCPYRYFLGEVLQLQAAKEVGDDWIDPTSQGNILHELFERHTRARIRDEAGVSRSDEEEMLSLLKQAIHRQVIRSGEDVEALVESRYRSLAHGVRSYFRQERRTADERQPIHAEFSFSDHDLADAPPARFQSERGELVMTGRIDRIDEAKDGSWIIVDYKTSKPDEFVPDKLRSMDNKLQWALYAWAASKTTGKTITSSEYVFTSHKGSGWVSAVAAPADAEIEPLLDDVLKRAASGHYMPAPEPSSTCQWCDFKSVCGDLTARKQMIKDKFREADPTETEAYEGWSFRTSASK